MGEATKWCSVCKVEHPRAAFGSDSSRGDGLAASCRDGRNRRARANHVGVAPELRRYGPRPDAPRSGDKLQARQRINVEVRTGRRPHPNTLPCADCGHRWMRGDKRHEYDHHRGYEPEHHLDVEPVCTKCHARRARDRGELVQTRGSRGRWVSRKDVMANG